MENTSLLTFIYLRGTGYSQIIVFYLFAFFRKILYQISHFIWHNIYNQCFGGLKQNLLSLQYNISIIPVKSRQISISTFFTYLYSILSAQVLFYSRTAPVFEHFSCKVSVRLKTTDIL